MALAGELVAFDEEIVALDYDLVAFTVGLVALFQFLVGESAGFRGFPWYILFIKLHTIFCASGLSCFD